MQILPATHSRMYKVDKCDFGIIKGLVTSFCQASKLHLLVKCLIEQLLFNIDFKNERLGRFFLGAGLWWWGGSVLLVRHNHFEHHTSSRA